MYECPECSQTMGLDEPMIVDHFSKQHAGFEEFQCLKCESGFQTVQAIQEHMAIMHASNYLFVGARRTSKPSEEPDDEIQVLYVGDLQNHLPYTLFKSPPELLSKMDPKKMTIQNQWQELQMLRMDRPMAKPMAHKGPVPRIVSSNKITLEFIRYSRYSDEIRQDKKCIPLLVTYKCITDALMQQFPSIVQHIVHERDIGATVCKATEFNGSMPSILRHRCRTHAPNAVVFLQIEQKLPIVVKKIVRCAFQCQLCAAKLENRTSLFRHFFGTHSDRWVAAKMSVSSLVVESNDPQQPAGSSNESIDYFFVTNLKCAKNDCNSPSGTRSQVIAHYNAEHAGDGSMIDGFHVLLGEQIVANKPQEIEAFVHEMKNAHQMYLFECQHCSKLFESFAAIKAHFAEIRAHDYRIELRFIVKPLYRCHGDPAIFTFAGMMQYASEHPEKGTIAPVNMHIQRTYCGLCSFNYGKKGNLAQHFAQKHAGIGGGGVACKDAFLKSLEVYEIQLLQCKYVAGCCDKIERNLLMQIIDHVLSCPLRFVCKRCPDVKCVSIAAYVAHCSEHDSNVDTAKIVNDLHDFKAFKTLLADMQIVFPNGLVMLMHELRDTIFGSELQAAIASIAQKAWTSEANDLRMVLMLG